MAPLLCLSPSMLDQSFPRDQRQLRTVAVCLGAVQQAVEEGHAWIVVTELLEMFVDEYDWGKSDLGSIQAAVYTYLCQLVVSSQQCVKHLNMESITDADPHPLPAGASLDGNASLWSEDTGKLLTAHDNAIQPPSFFIGIACDVAFSGGGVGGYFNPLKARAFPLVGRAELVQLEDSLEWQVDANIRYQHVYVNDVKKNFAVIGGHYIRDGAGSHRQVVFPGARTWPLDENHDPCLEVHLRELANITGLPLNVLKYALIRGVLPPRRFRLEAYEKH